MEKQTVKIADMSVDIPAYYQRTESMPGDPEGSVPYAVRTENALCVVFLSQVDNSKSLPREQETLIEGIRHFLGAGQGLIKAEAKDDYVYSIVKSLKEPSGVQYILTYQKFYEDGILMIRGFFEETGVTGIRDNMIFAMHRRENPAADDDNPFEGWSKDPYDESITAGVLMNLSEQEKYDEMFPGFPLTMCREFVNCLSSAT